MVVIKNVIIQPVPGCLTVKWWSLFGRNYLPANTQRRRNVVITSLQRYDVAATLLRRCMFTGLVWPRKHRHFSYVHMSFAHSGQSFQNPSMFHSECLQRQLALFSAKYKEALAYCSSDNIKFSRVRVKALNPYCYYVLRWAYDWNIWDLSNWLIPGLSIWEILEIPFKCRFPSPPTHNH